MIERLMLALGFPSAAVIVTVEVMITVGLEISNKLAAIRDALWGMVIEENHLGRPKNP